MNGSRSRGGAVALALVSLGMLSFAAPRSSVAAPTPAGCSKRIADYRGDYEGPRLRGFACKMGEDLLPWKSQEIAWTVPPRVKAAEFLVLGGSDATTGHGGEVDAALPVTPGETLVLLLGIDGGATSVSRGGVPLIVAAGSNGQQPSFVSPNARNTAVRAPGLPAPPYPQHGSIYVSWLHGYGSGIKGQVPSDCVVPTLRGENPSEAREMLTGSDCRVGSISRVLARPANRGLVIRQSPKPGTVLPRASEVDFVVGQGP